MSRIFKRFAALLLVLTLALPLAACKKPSQAQKAAETDAVSVGSHTISAVMLNYFYMDAVTDWYSKYGTSLGLDASKPLNEQVMNKETGKTWADSFMEIALDNIKSTYALYDLAMADNFTISKNDQYTLDTTIDELKSMIEYYTKLYSSSGYTYPYTSVEQYLEAVYGAGATPENYIEYCRICTYANAYFTAYGDSLKYTPQQLQAYEKDKAERYNAYSFTMYYVNASDYESAADAKAVADQLATGGYADKAALDEAIKALAINADKKNPTLSKAYISTIYPNINTDYAQWVSDKARVPGELGVVARESTTGDATTVKGYYVILFEGLDENRYTMKTIRQILLAYEGGVLDSNTGVTTYPDKEMAEVKLEAEKLLLEFRAGTATELKFASLADKHTDESEAPEGGLYENTYRGQLVPAVEAWCFDPVRNPGDTSLVETEKGWYLMYFVSNSELTFRDHMITNDLRNEDISAWYKALLEKVSVTLLDDSFVNKALILSSL